MMEMYNAYIYHGDNSEDSATCKIHLHFHCPENSFHIGAFHNYDAGKGEWGLKTWAKAAAKTAQKRGQDVFLGQTVSRIRDKNLLQKADKIIELQFYLKTGTQSEIEHPCHQVKSSKILNLFGHWIAYLCNHLERTAGALHFSGV